MPGQALRLDGAVRPRRSGRGGTMEEAPKLAQSRALRGVCVCPSSELRMALQEGQGGRALRVSADRMPELRIGATARYVALAAT